MTVLYFAYGSNLWLEQMRARCPSAVVVGKAWLDGYRLTFTGFSWGWGGATATIIKDPKGKVPGAIYEIRSVEDVKRLDAFEGCPAVHTSVEVLVRVPKREARMKVWTYIKREERTGAPSEEYARTIATGLRQHGHGKYGIDNLVNAMAKAMVDAGASGYSKGKRSPSPVEPKRAGLDNVAAPATVAAPPKPAPRNVWTGKDPWLCEKCKTPQAATVKAKALDDRRGDWLLVCAACAEEADREPELPAPREACPTTFKGRQIRFRFGPPGVKPPATKTAPRFSADDDAPSRKNGTTHKNGGSEW